MEGEQKGGVFGCGRVRVKVKPEGVGTGLGNIGWIRPPRSYLELHQTAWISASNLAGSNMSL